MTTGKVGVRIMDDSVICKLRRQSQCDFSIAVVIFELDVELTVKLMKRCITMHYNVFIKLVVCVYTYCIMIVCGCCFNFF